MWQLTLLSLTSHIDFTCFSKALGTSRLSSDRLWLILSRRLFSMIYQQRDSQDQTVKTRLTTEKPKAIIHSPLFASFGPESARHCQETWTQWPDFTKRQTDTRKSEYNCSAGRGVLWVFCILLLLPTNTPQRRDGTWASFNLICVLGTEGHRSTHKGKEDTIVFCFNAFVDISLTEITCCSSLQL